MLEKTLGLTGSLGIKTALVGILIAAAALLLVPQTAGAQTIDTVAGNGVMGYGGDGGAATDAALNRPRGVAFDRSGNMYIADLSNHRVRKVTPAGTITTFAGTGVPGYSGDGGPATAAMLNEPVAVAAEADGDVIIADAQNRRIRRVDASTGVITTIAGTGTEGYSGDGGPATGAMLRRAVELEIDAAGNIYFADSVDNRIRKISPAGIITSVAGTGSAGYSGDGGPALSAMLDTPTGVALDRIGNLYIADAGNHRIRQVKAADGSIITVAGNGTGAGTDSGSYSGDGGPAIQAGLNFPEDVALDAAGNMYIADMANYRIRKVDAGTGVISTIAGTGEDGFSGDGGPAVEAKLNLPWSIVLDRLGNVYFADLWNNRIRVIRLGSAPTHAVFDFDGDGQTDISVWRPAEGTWSIRNSSDGSTTTRAWGTQRAGDVAVSADYDGDGITDIAVWRSQQGIWYVLRSSDSQMASKAWGTSLAGDVPVPADYDGDGKADLAVYRPATATWYIVRSSDGGITAEQFGDDTLFDVPVAGDYDGDGRADIAVWRPYEGVWLILQSSDGSIRTRAWGSRNAGDTPVPGDYDGDGTTDIAVWRSGIGWWYILKSSDGQMLTRPWGTVHAGDVPVPGDYDGDGQSDIAVWRAPEATWYIWQSSQGQSLTVPWGQDGDLPLPSIYTGSAWE